MSSLPAPKSQKEQPWRQVWPAPQGQQATQQYNFGFKEGEKMVMDGNAGNFWARDSWVVEQESSDSKEKTAGQ